jgi:tripartite-type tricarboxylate transporter receptor subunit TctC
MRMTHVAYKGGGQAVTDVVAGQVPILVTALATAGPFIRDGRLKAIAMTSGKRVRSAPQVPTVAESGVAGVAGFDVSSWYGIVAPAGTPAPVVHKLHARLARILDDPDTRARLEAIGAEPIGDSPTEFAAIIGNDLLRWAGIVKAAGISLQ